jgi:hypothetical protein
LYANSTGIVCKAVHVCVIHNDIYLVKLLAVYLPYRYIRGRGHAIPLVGRNP